MSKERIELIIQNATQVVTCSGEALADLNVLTNVAVAVSGEIIIAIDTLDNINAKYNISEAKVIDATGKVVAPGFIDSHTHLVFYGARAEEYAYKVAGKDLEKLQAEGYEVGPDQTVKLTCDKPADELFEQSKKRVLDMIKHGITTIESKSGYGLKTEAELKILRIGRRLDEETPVDIMNTFLGAHGIPEGKTKEEYIDEIINEMIPKVAAENLAEFCDVWCDDGYFTKEESRRILMAGLAHNMLPKIHADAYSYIGGSDLAAEMNMVSVDHLNYTPENVMKELAKTDCVGVLMPALDFAVAHKKPFNARKLIDSGMKIALATDICPACYTVSMQFVINLACRLYSFSIEEAIKAATVGGAQALRLEDRGRLEAGYLADIQIWNIPRYEHIAYELGSNAVETVIKRGAVVI